MSSRVQPLISFLKELMRRRKLLPSHLAAELGISHATVSRWLSGKDIPSIQSCRKLAEFSDTSVDTVLSLAGYLPETLVGTYSSDLPDFREYAMKKYPRVFDEDLLIMIEDLIERRRARNTALRRKKA